MRIYGIILAFLVVGLTVPFAVGDWIVLNGTTHQEVYIREGRSAYFVHFPDSGGIVNVPRDSIADRDIGIHEDEEHRESLLQVWRENNPARERDGEQREEVRRHLADARKNAPVPPAPMATPAAQSGTQARPLALGGNTLARVMPGNAPTGFTAAPARMQSAALAPASSGPMQRAGAFPGGGMRMPGYGQQAVGGMGGMGGGFGRDVTVISNISDMFFNIDDRMVGEAPAQILPAYVILRR